MSRAQAPFFALAAFLAAPAALACGPSPGEIAIIAGTLLSILAVLQLSAVAGVRFSLGRRYGRAARVAIALLIAPVVAVTWLLCFSLMQGAPVAGVVAISLEMLLTLSLAKALALPWLRPSLT